MTETPKLTEGAPITIGFQPVNGTVHDWDDEIRVVRVVIAGIPGVHCYSYDQILSFDALSERAARQVWS